ncbi:MAG: sensor histidine kinase [Allosphingosinicella sp.]
MRFDDTIATAMAQPADRADRRAAQWRQLVDLLAQPRSDADPVERERAFTFLRAHRFAVDAGLRRAAAQSLTGLAVTPDLMVYFAEDSAAVAAPLIAGARLETSAWLTLLPRLGPPARALLRHRRDLAPEVHQALGAYGAFDFILESSAPAAEQPADPAAATLARTLDQDESQIQEMVERIEAYRRQQQQAKAAARNLEPAAPADTFRWETGTEGLMRWIDGAAREALIGQSIAVIAGNGHYGVDGQAAGAFEKRTPFRDARFSVAGKGPASGDWRVSGVPFFDPHSGAFLGYRGTARRPRLDETARSVGEGEGLFGTHFPPDSLRQLIHELRTPLNAIMGFAELIEGQHMGPAATGYRDRASGIMEQARRLLSAVDDLDTAARLETKRLHLEESAVDAAALLGRLHQSYERVARQRGSRLTLAIAPDLPPAMVEPGAAERMLARLLAATIGLADDGETIAAEMAMDQRANRPMLRVSLDRPQAIDGLGEASLLDPGYSPEGDWPGAPALGLGFALRLVRNLAEAAGGALVIGDERISLYLPASSEAPSAAGEGG